MPKIIKYSALVTHALNKLCTCTNTNVSTICHLELRLVLHLELNIEQIKIHLMFKF